MSRHLHIPEQSQGSLHLPEVERDSCGVGVVCHLRGERSRRVLKLGLDSVCNVIHRGALDADGKTGDGAGISTQIPYRILLPVAEALGRPVATESDLGVGVFFLPPDHAAEIKVIIEGIVSSRGLGFIGWRDVPQNLEALGKKALATKPEIVHLLVARPQELIDHDDYERRLYICRREIETVASKWRGFYACSFSHRLIVYKGFLVATALRKFYTDLEDPAYETAICLYHQRFSTNTFPTWALAQPFRMMAHNGEINTVRGNRNWFNSRTAQFHSKIWGDDVKFLRDAIDPHGSDSASLDTALEMLVLSGRSLEHTMTMLVPPAWRIDPNTSPEVQDFFRYHSCFAEAWDGPAALAFTDGVKVAACLDRNGLRPSRYKITDDGIFALGSEVGTCDIDDATVIEKGRLGPGQMILVDTSKGIVKHNNEIRQGLAEAKPYGKWIQEHRLRLDDHSPVAPPEPTDDLDILGLTQQQLAFGYNSEELEMVLTPMAKTGEEAVYSMGDDAALSVLSLRPKVLFSYFKQLFAQVTNPPIDPIRERLVMSLEADLGPERNLLEETPEHARVVHLSSPFLFKHQLEVLRNIAPDFPQREIDITWPVGEGVSGMETAIQRICAEATKAVDDSVRIIILTDRRTSHDRVAVPALLATSAVHTHLNVAKKRMLTSLVVETAEARDTHHMACLFGFGATAVCPYLAHGTVRDILQRDTKGELGGISLSQALSNYHYALEKGVLKIMSKMGISVLNSYQGAQIFEAVGISSGLISQCFAGTPSQIEGIGFAEIARDALTRHEEGFGQAIEGGAPPALEDPGYFRFRRDGERHAINQPVLKNFHSFVKTNKPDEYEAYVAAVKATQPISLRDLLEFAPAANPIPIDEVEPIESIRRRFTTAAMSLGALSPEAHETLAIAMNRIGGKSNSGEGGEEERRFTRYENGDWGNSRIKQIASGRFGVHAHYLMSADELEIKMAQGAKPGEGGQLPGHKVNGIIATLRHTQPGVTLISPPPHHDIYSIEDLAQLIHDLKQVNPRAKICVKLVAESGVGTVAAGVAKANADIILVSGHDGGTGASPLSSIKNAGLPWEIGLAETQQVLVLNGLRDRVTLRTDGGLRTGLDIVHAALLGAEEYNFGTIALIAMGCVYVRRCHLNTCPVGIATQDEKLRGKFKGTADNVVNFFNAVSHEVREILAGLGVHKLDDIIGQTSLLRQRVVPEHPKANTISLSRLLRDVSALPDGTVAPKRCLHERNEGVHQAELDDGIIEETRAAILARQPATVTRSVRNTNRNLGTRLSGFIADHFGNTKGESNFIHLQLSGSAGQSLGTFLVQGVRITLTGEANDYVGKGMSGGEIVIRPPALRHFVAEDNSILGNTVMYGSTGGRLFASGRAGERFCVRNSGGTAVVEGVGDHGCEYMTNGTVVILGETGKNFGAGMSGGTAYIYDPQGQFPKLLNAGMVTHSPIEDPLEAEKLRTLIEEHRDLTGSGRAAALLEDWDKALAAFHKVGPKAAAPAPATVAAAAGK